MPQKHLKDLGTVTVVFDDDEEVVVKVDQVEKTYRTTSYTNIENAMKFKCPACHMSTGTDMQKCPFDQGGNCATLVVIDEAERLLEQRYDEQFKNVDGAGI